MAHFAKIENDIVTRVIIIDNEFESDGQNWINDLFGTNDEWIQTSYNNNFRANYAGKGYTYDRINDVFIPLQPYPSWMLNSEWKWEAPIEYPSDGKFYYWDEDELNWIEEIL